MRLKQLNAYENVAIIWKILVNVVYTRTTILCFTSTESYSQAYRTCVNTPILKFSINMLYLTGNDNSACHRAEGEVKVKVNVFV